MPHQLNTLTPNLVVADVARSVAFYRDVLGFVLDRSVPDGEPYAFAMMRTGDVYVFLNAPTAAAAEYPMFSDRPIGGTLTLFFAVTGIADAWAALKDRVDVVMPLEKKWYGMTEFAFLDPDGYVLTYAEREEQS
ncbi:MAG TPA: VOC family protein [Vicinamibacterales bacterium]|nr:VOC family protein [Vicinamibacterales bacterium]